MKVYRCNWVYRSASFHTNANKTLNIFSKKYFCFNKEEQKEYLCKKKNKMTTALKNILTKLNKMPVAEQNAIAALLNDELNWKKSFENSENELLNLAKEAVVEYKKGKTRPLNLE